MKINNWTKDIKQNYIRNKCETSNENYTNQTETKI
jgi:hypothetical protein